MIQFDFDSIKIATNDFASENKLGQGGFGAVYKVLNDVKELLMMMAKS